MPSTVKNSDHNTLQAPFGGTEEDFAIDELSNEGTVEETSNHEVDVRKSGVTIASIDDSDLERFRATTTKLVES